MTSIDRLHSRCPLRIAEGIKGTRINFPCEVRTPQKTRTVLVGWSDGLLPKYPDCRCSASSSQRIAAKLFGYLPKETLRTISNHESGYVLICRHVDWNFTTQLAEPIPSCAQATCGGTSRCLQESAEYNVCREIP